MSNIAEMTIELLNQLKKQRCPQCTAVLKVSTPEEQGRELRGSVKLQKRLGLVTKVYIYECGNCDSMYTTTHLSRFLFGRIIPNVIKLGAR